MDHHYINEHNIADRYLMGKLLAEERAQFEEHFIDCKECLDRLEVTEDLRRGLQCVAAEEAARSRIYVQVGLLGWLVRQSRRRQAALLVCALLLMVALPTIFFIKEKRGRDELAETKIASADWQRQYAGERQAAEALEQKLQHVEQNLDEQRQQLQTQLGREQQARVSLADELNRLTQPQVNTPIFVLNTVRSSDLNQSEAVNKIVISPSSQWIVLSLEPEPEYETYRATLSTANNPLLWKQSGLQPNPRGEVVISFNSSFFRPGDYLLTLSPEGQPLSVAKYPFRVISKK